jgi:hypothetical protein
MSSALAIAGVTAVLRDLLNDGLINHNVSGVLGSTVTVSTSSPDRVVPTNGTESSQLNLFLHQVTPNTGWRNEGLPSRDGSGRHRLSNPPLALNLHYLLSAYSGGDLHAEILLGYAMHFLHETPVFTRQAIRNALTPSPLPGTALQRALADSGLVDQIEQIKITPEYLNTEETSNLWTATQSHFRPTAAYMASVVLIEATEPIGSPLPVLSRGPVDPVSQRDRGVVVEPSLVPPLPMLEAVVPPGGQPVARLGETIDLRGHHLDGTGHTVLLTNDRFEIEDSAAIATGSAALMQFSLPIAQAADFPVGAYRVGARVLRPGETEPRETNRLAMTLAPEITGLPMNVARDGAGTASFTLSFHPQLRAGQSVVLVLGEQEILPQPFAAPTTSSLNFGIEDAPVASPPGLLARLRIDGIDSPIIDRSIDPPVFLNQRIVIT